LNSILLVALFLLVGFVAGTGSGLIGIGGGIIYIPALLFLLPLLGVSDNNVVLTAITTSLFTAMFSSGTAFYNHLKLKNVRIKKAALFVLGSIVMSTIIPHFVVKMNPVIPKIVLLIVLIAAFIKVAFTKNENMEAKYLLKEYYLILFGLFVGTLSALSGIGGGLVVIPVLITFFGVEFKYAIGTSTMVVFITILSSSFSYWIISGSENGLFGFINLFAAIPMIVGAIIGAIYGTKIGQKFSTSTIKVIFSVILIFVIIKLIFEI